MVEISDVQLASGWGAMVDGLAIRVNRLEEENAELLEEIKALDVQPGPNEIAAKEEARAIAEVWLYVDSKNFQIPGTKFGLDLKWALETLIPDPRLTIVWEEEDQ